MTNPWDDPKVAEQQRALVDRQIDDSVSRPNWFIQWCKAVADTKCPGSILEFGCASGYGRQLLDYVGVKYSSYTGVDISRRALEIAKERYPESRWLPELPPETFDVVADGCALMHVDDPRATFDALAKRSRRWLILSRVPVGVPGKGGSEFTTSGYGKQFPATRFDRADLVEWAQAAGFELGTRYAVDNDTLTIVYARPRHWVTYASKSYLGRLRALYRSMRQHCAPFVLHVLCWDDDVRAEMEDWHDVEGTHIDDFLELHPDLKLDALPGPQRTYAEHLWTVGAQWVADCAKRGPVTYVDADVMFHSSPEPLFLEYTGESFAVPHNFPHRDEKLPGVCVETHRVFGLFNVGIVHFGCVGLAQQWADKCQKWCYDKLAQVAGGDYVYGDQVYLQRICAPDGDYLKTVHHINSNHACVGPWNVHNRALDVRNGVIHYGGQPLIAYHYSALQLVSEGGCEFSRPEYQLTKRQTDILYAPYLAALESRSIEP